MTADLQPDELESMQAEYTGPEPAARVVLASAEGVVRVQVLPRKQGGTRTKTIGTTPSQILSADHRRAQALLIAPAAFLVAYSSASAQDSSTMAAWPANVPLPITADVPVYAAAVAATVALSVITEYWATGE
jgi:hypothetical protein